MSRVVVAVLWPEVVAAAVVDAVLLRHSAKGAVHVPSCVLGMHAPKYPHGPSPKAHSLQARLDDVDVDVVVVAVVVVTQLSKSVGHDVPLYPEHRLSPALMQRPRVPNAQLWHSNSREAASPESMVDVEEVVVVVAILPPGQGENPLAHTFWPPLSTIVAQMPS